VQNSAEKTTDALVQRRVEMTMSSKLYTIKFDQIELRSDSISIHFLTKIYLGPWIVIHYHL
jgi:hypothetical protein